MSPDFFPEDSSFLVQVSHLVSCVSNFIVDLSCVVIAKHSASVGTVSLLYIFL